MKANDRLQQAPYEEQLSINNKISSIVTKFLQHDCNFPTVKVVKIDKLKSRKLWLS